MYEGLQYTDADIVDFETRLTRIYRKEVHRVHVFNFGGLADLMAKGLSARMLMEHRDAQRVLYRVDGGDFYENCGDFYENYDELWFIVINNPFWK
ncbi:hypothetical protein Tco_1147357, partial [Tanacetum coccineum]